MTPLKSCELELSRFFNKYDQFCVSSDVDSLKDLLAVMCSACEKFKKVKTINLEKNKRYRALKALRNFATHESELLNSSKALSLNSVRQVYAEVQLMCLLPKAVLNYALRGLKSKQTKKFLTESVIHYDKYIDIYPTLYNFTVDLYFEVKNQELNVEGSGFESIENSIQYEITNGFPHYINGKVVMLDGSSIDAFLESQTIDIETKNHETANSPVDEDGLFSFVTGYKEMPHKEAALMKKEDKKYILNLLLETGVVKFEEGEFSSTRPLNAIEIVLVSEYLENMKAKN